MTLLIDERRQLAAPVAIFSVPPSLFSVEDVVPLDVFADGTPGYLTQARNLVESWPNSIVALVRLAQAEAAGGRRDLAIEVARRVADRASSDEWLSRLAAARVLAACGAAQVAEAVLAETDMTLEPVRVFYASLAAERRDHSEALDRLGDVEGSDGLALAGWIALERNEFDQAIRLYRRTMSAGGPSPGVLANLGYAHAALGSRHRAIRETREGWLLSPTNRLIGLNLVGFYVADNDYSSSLDVINRLRMFFPNDVELSLAEASVHAASANYERAYRTLRRARTSLWAYASKTEQLELAVNLHHLEWRLGKKTRESVAAAVLDELTRYDFGSADVHTIVPVLLPRRGDLDRIRSILEKFSEAHPDAPFYSLRIHEALVDRRYEDACSLALEWMSADIFDPYAASTAAYLVADVRGDYAKAAEIGGLALRRTASTDSLLNNTAYALALAGRTDEALATLPKNQTPYVLATRALIDMCRGDIDKGLAGYESAYEAAQELPDDELPTRVLLYRALALARFGASDHGVERAVEEALGDPRMPADLDDDANFHLLKYAIGRVVSMRTSAAPR
jgi:tetratricopeptide (TPR) repeat protein